MSELSKRVDRWMLRDIERSKTMDTELEYHLINDLHNALQAAIKQDKQEPEWTEAAIKQLADAINVRPFTYEKAECCTYLRCNALDIAQFYTYPAPTEWRKVDDELPKERIRVNAWDGLIVAECFLDSDGGWKDSDGKPVQFPITHWKPLPEPPAELKGE